MTSSGPTGDAFPSTAVGPEENGDGIFAEGGGECGGGVELFPVNFTEYQHHPSLRTDEHVQEIYELLAPYSVRLDQWTVPPEQRDRQAVEDRLRAWKHPDASRSGNTVLYWLGHGSAERMAHHRTPAPIDDGTTPQDVASAIADRQLHPNTEHSWSIVVLDACFSKSFAKSVERALTGYDNDLYRYVLLSTAARGPAELGAFTEALRRVLRITFRGRPSIGLAELGNALVSELGGHQTIKITNKYRLYRTQPDIADSITASLDELDEVRAVIANLSADEQRHFLPKASGAELGELAWYFQGRAVERNEILHWLTTATSGALVVTGPAGAGKSALLGHILHYTLSQLRDILLQRKALQHLPPGIACPDDPFDLVTHLVGLTSAQVLHLIAQAAGLTDLAVQAADDRPPADLVHRIITELRHRRTPLTLLFDALDEAEQPLVIANQILRPLAALPTVRLIVGTRSSTREGPDHPAPTDTDILDALRPRPHPDSPVPPSFKIIDVNREKAAFADYLRAKLGKLHADHASIEEIVRRLVTDHPQDSAETQQFLHVRLVAHELLNDPRLLADPTPLIGRTHRQLFTQALQRLHRTNPHYTPLLRALGLTQGRGLPDQDNIWAHAANALGSHADTSRSISGLVRDAAPYITADHENGQSVYRFAHRTFAEHFVTAPDASQAHADITAALIRRAREDVNATLDGTPRLDEDVSPYIRHHLAAHARLGHAAGALNTLADHPDVLDTLDLTSISSAALYSGLPAAKLPPPLAGIVLFYNQGHRDGGKQEDDETGWRRWWRRLGTAYIHGTVPPGEPLAGTPPLWPPTLAAGVVRPRQLNQQLTAHTDSVSAVAVFTAVDGTARVVTGSDDGTVRIWNPTTSAQEAQLPHHGHRVGAVVVFTAVDGTARIITDSDDGVVRIWNPTTSAQEAQLPHHGHKVGLVAVFTGWDGIPRVVTGSDDGTVRIWNPTTRTREHKLTSRKGRLRELAVFTALDGILHVVTGSDDGVVRIWNPTRPQETRLTSVTASVSVVAVFTAVDGTPYVVTGSYDGTVRIWNPTTRTQEAQLTGHGHRVGAVAVFTAVDGTPRVVAGSDDGVVRIWNPTRSQEARLTGHTESVGAVAVFTAVDGTPRVVTGSGDGVVRIWNPTTRTQEARLTGHTESVGAVAVFTAVDGTPRVVTGSGDGVVRIWNPTTRTQEARLTGHTESVSAVAVFTGWDGTPRVVTGSYDGTVRIWNPTTRTQEHKLRRRVRVRWVSAVAVFTAADGTPRVVAGSDDGVVRIWNPATRIQEAQLTSRKGRLKELAVFTAVDGTPRVVTGSHDGTVRIWNPTTRTQEAELTGHTGWVSAVAVFTAVDGTPRVVTGGHDGTVRIWNPTTRTQETQLTGHTGWVSAVTVFTARDGTRHLAIGQIDEKVLRICNLRTRTVRTLPLQQRVFALQEQNGLLFAGGSSGYLAIDISSMPSD